MGFDDLTRQKRFKVHRIKNLSQDTYLMFLGIRTFSRIARFRLLSELQYMMSQLVNANKIVNSHWQPKKMGLALLNE